MTTRMDICRRIAATSAFVGAFVLTASAARAQDATSDPRWQAWVGCWRPADAPPDLDGSDNVPTVCVIPAAGTSAVDIVTIVSGEIAARERVEATGEQQPRSSDGCTGWQRAEWSPDGRRVYLRSEHTCAGDLKRASSGLFAMSPTGDWLDVEGVTSGENTGVRVSRFEEVRYPGELPSEVASALQGQPPSSRAARTVATSPLTPMDVVEASRQLDAAVVEAWLVENEQGFELDAERLVALADAGLSERVIDVMVALSYPRVFAINRATRQGDFRAPDSTRNASMYDGRYAGTIYTHSDRFGYGSCYSSWYGYSPYGCSRYGYGSGYGYGYGYGWYPGQSPVIIIQRPGGDQVDAPNGKVVKGRGYIRGNRNSDQRGSSDASTSRRPGRSSGSSTSGSPSDGAGSSSGSGSGRTAKPRSP